ncbi:hypothetical protein, partial [Salinispora cortesiana]|uniref:hypothetical protein n=1 Tax=Salinispora cortesiana TaxID=1305843 RepID=UPI000472AEA9
MAWPFTRRKPAPATGWVPAADTRPAADSLPAGGDSDGEDPTLDPATPAPDSVGPQSGDEPRPLRRAGVLRRTRWLDRQGFYEPR